MKFIEVNCPVCSANDYKIVSPDTLGENPPVFGYKWSPEVLKRYRAVMCNCCGHVYSSPRLEDIYQYYQDIRDENYLENENLRMETAKQVIPIIRRFAPSGKLLDVGCSTGDFLTVAHESYEVEGLELSHWASEIALKSGLMIHRKKLSEMAGSNSLYDVITLWGVIEHLEYPCNEMVHVNRLLKSGGIVCFWTGDVDSIYFRILRKRWWYLMGQHIQLFSKKSMDRMMRDAGFELAYRGVYPYVMSFEYLSTLLSRYPVIGTLTKKLFHWMTLDKHQFTFKKSDEMFAIYKKTTTTG